jgi:DNA replication and repair protein RecF
MKLLSVDIVNFRNHADTGLSTAERVNGFIGENGQGKTSLLEAISALCLTKSVFGSRDDELLQIGKEAFSVRGEFGGDTGVRYAVGLSYSRVEDEKSFTVNGAAPERFSDVVGQFPVVALAPEMGTITAGGPVERRRFLDFVIAQASKIYLEDLIEYRRVLKQRNRILLDARLTRVDCRESLEPWSAELIDRGSRITTRRAGLIEEFKQLVEEAYHDLAGKVETPGIQYEPSIPMGEGASDEEIRVAFEAELGRKGEDERQTGATLVGPHRDEVGMTINGLGVRKYTSQGQHKTFVVALKVAEFRYLHRRRNERPILLLDDIFGQLDGHRAERLLELIGSLGQAFVTATGDNTFPVHFEWGGANRRFLVQEGSVVYDEASSIIR